jgi:hypothetical protein
VLVIVLLWVKEVLLRSGFEEAAVVDELGEGGVASAP